LGSVLEVLQKWTNRYPDKLLYSFLDLGGKGIASYSYQAFEERIDLIASHLRVRRGLENGDRVLLAYPPGLEMLCALFACARAGLIAVPVNTPGIQGFQAALFRIEHIARDCQAVALLTSRAGLDLLRRNLSVENGNDVPPEIRALTKLDWIVTEDLVEPAGKVLDTKVSEIFLLQYTSGSTNSPKGVIVSHDNIISNCRLVIDHEAPIAVCWLPQHHDMGLIGCYLFMALSGGTTYGFSPMTFIQKPSLWLETIAKYRATCSSAPNFAYEYCLWPGRLPAAMLAKLDLASLALLMAAAEPIKPDTYRRFLQRFEEHGLRRASFVVAYGLAENTLAVSNYGRNTVSLNKGELALGRVRMTRDTSEIAGARHLMSCGTPLGDNRVKIVEPETCASLAEGEIGEIWVAGASKCLGYWNDPEMTRQSFRARISGDADDQHEYLRTGDLGFLHEAELYVCGRRKDMIIVRGQNYYPQDIEAVIEQTSPLVRKGCVAAFELEEDQEPTIAVVAEVTRPRAIPDARAIMTAVKEYLNVDVDRVVLVPRKAVPKTTSGKIMRSMTKQMLLAGQFQILSQLVREKGSEAPLECGDARSPFGFLKSKYKLKGDEPYPLIEAGIDSLDLVLSMHELQELVAERGTTLLADQVDVRLIQQVRIAELFSIADLFKEAPEAALVRIHHLLTNNREEYRAIESATMVKDEALSFIPVVPGAMAAEETRTVLLTGGTGFLGPFLLRSLLEQTEATVYVLVRAATVDHAHERLRAAMDTAAASGDMLAQFDKRVVPICGDLEEPALGLSVDRWAQLASEVDAIYHNGASVNYVFNYGKMRAANVGGTNEALRLAFDRRLKQFNYVSTTFIFGWAVKDRLYETDNNAGMELLDFGYSQSKWVAERLVADATRHGLGTRIFRPSFITPSLTGGGNNFDIMIRLLAFMIKQGIGVDTLNQVSFVPADVTANNIVAIANVSDTINGTFHVTRDEYANMTDVTNIITAQTGRRFDRFPLREFVPELIRRCTKDDLLFPLLDFVIGSIDKISAMEFKRYDNSSYQKARNSSAWGVADPPLEVIVAGILKFISRTGVL
jgi:thioester reductase-like protein